MRQSSDDPMERPYVTVKAASKREDLAVIGCNPLLIRVFPNQKGARCKYHKDPHCCMNPTPLEPRPSAIIRLMLATRAGEKGAFAGKRLGKCGMWA